MRARMHRYIPQTGTDTLTRRHPPLTCAQWPSAGRCFRSGEPCVSVTVTIILRDDEKGISNTRFANLDARDVNIHVYGCMDVWMYVWMYVCMDVWMYVCMYGWMDGWMDVQIYTSIYLSLIYIPI